MFSQVACMLTEKKYTPASLIFYWHLMLCVVSIVIFDTAYCLVDSVTQSMQQMTPYTAWATLKFSIHKPSHIALYAMGVIAYFLYFLFGTFALSQARKYREKTSSFFAEKSVTYNGYYLFGLCFFGVFLIKILLWHHPASMLFLELWLVVFLSSFLLIPKIDQSFDSVAPCTKNTSIGCAVLTLAAFVVLLVALFPYFSLSHLKIHNDFLWVPEKTLLDGHYVDNTEYVMKRGIRGLYSGELINAPNDIDLSKYNHIQLTEANSLKNLIDYQHDLQIFNLDYNERLKTLFVRHDLTERDKYFLCQWVTQRDCEAIQRFRVHHNIISPLDEQFVKKNTFGGISSTGSYFYHQNALFEPVNAFFLGKETSKVKFFYGFGSTLWLTYLSTLIWQDLSFEKLTALLHIHYPIYFIFLLLASCILLRDSRWVALVFILSVASILMLSFPGIKWGPGLNPLRHLLDLPLIIFFYLYIYAKRFDTVFLILSYLVALLAVVLNKEFGAMLMVSLTLATVMHVVCSSKKFINFFVVGAAGAVFILVCYYLHIATGKDSTSKYMFLGVGMSSAGLMDILSLLAAIFLGYSSMLYVQLKCGLQHKPLFVALLLFLYSQFLIFYYILCSDSSHFLAMSPIFWLCATYLFKELLTCYYPPVVRKKIVIFGMIVIAIPLLVYTGSNYFLQESDYNRTFLDHKLYRWDFNRAHFLSTMDPAVFVESVRLIDRYSVGRAIYIISRYDSLLPFLSERYSAMPYPSLNFYLVTDRETKAVGDVILHDRPQYLFVDSDINGIRIGDSADPNYSLDSPQLNSAHSKSRSILMASEMQKIFNAVKNDYKLIEKGALISVYERKNSV